MSPLTAYGAYAGIGSRETPPDVLEEMSQVAKRLAWRGWTLRTGGAPGADQAFAIGAASAMTQPLTALLGKDPCSGSLELYLPWPGFESEHIQALMLAGVDADCLVRAEPQEEAFAVAEEYHPAWERCSQGAKRLHARNVHQILGPDVMSYVLAAFVICWTPWAASGGGTGQAIRIANHYGVPVYDMADSDTRAWVNGLGREEPDPPVPAQDLEPRPISLPDPPERT